ncbi:uncharacterized protein MELLADRAFT_104911 [Melampsora larici-populina 98AG31]|uniref:Uncharacterized protein n=1 Tax=Melampsora larici-populina (strain 98AG31 / pathotype 3-4-7) TaxID=747676 RepID=F4RGH7_MELLP|nr:uncharacterized protein MELLADRAFT_104911 [Melampsora larici-populina 98AG31]EGG08647.1 hypothetical protein MELLADRAFT_104911 [Melampsora larici-populina 98AG31]
MSQMVSEKFVSTSKLNAYKQQSAKCGIVPGIYPKPQLCVPTLAVFSTESLLESRTPMPIPTPVAFGVEMIPGTINGFYRNVRRYHAGNPLHEQDDPTPIQTGGQSPHPGQARQQRRYTPGMTLLSLRMKRARYCLPIINPNKTIRSVQIVESIHNEIMAQMSHLPVEIVEHIMTYLFDMAKYSPLDASNSADTLFLNQNSVTCLLRLRLLGKVWARLIPKFVFNALELRSSRTHRCISFVLGSSVKLSSTIHLKRLFLNGITYLPESWSGSYFGKITDNNLTKPDFEHQDSTNNLIRMKDAANIISLCGSTLTDLKICFTDAVGFSNNLVEAIKRVTSLKVLIVESLRVERHLCAGILFATLTSLSLDPGALPNLIHLCVDCHVSNHRAIVHFCQRRKSSIKLLEYQPKDYANDETPMLLALQDTLEAISVIMMPDDIPLELRNSSFPNLRILKNMFINPRHDYPQWLGWAIFREVEIYITCYSETAHYWRDKFEQYDGLEFPKKLSQFIFLTEDNHSVNDEALAGFLNRRRIKCRFETQLSYSQILKSIKEPSDNLLTVDFGVLAMNSSRQQAMKVDAKF